PAVAQKLSQLPADQEVVRKQLALEAIEVVAAAVEQVGQQPFGRPGLVDGIDDDSQLHPAPPLRRESCSDTPRIQVKAQSAAKSAHGSLIEGAKMRPDARRQGGYRQRIYCLISDLHRCPHLRPLLRVSSFGCGA